MNIMPGLRSAQRAKAWFVHVALRIFWGRLPPVTVLKSLNDLNNPASSCGNLGKIELDKF